MKTGITWALIVISVTSVVSMAVGQNVTEPTIPAFVKYSGSLTDVSGRPVTGTVEITFSLYKEQQGGTALWMESQKVQADSLGNYAVTLGSTTIQGLPSSLFVAREARWLGVQVEGQPEATRVMLLSVPYALKAGDSETLGGLPASAFMLAGTAGAVPQNAVAPNSESSTALSPALGGTGTTDFLPLWSNSTTLGNSVLFQAGTGSTARLGINTTSPATTLDVKGAATVRGNLGFPATGVATATAGKNSQSLTFTASVFNSSSTTPVNENFLWQAEPVGNNTATATGSLNLLSAQGTGAYAETGLKLGRSGLITFAPGQKFPGTGTITGLTAGSGLTGGGTSGNITLKLEATKVPLLNTNNTFTGSLTTFTGDVVVDGYVLAIGSVAGETSTPGGDGVYGVSSADGGYGVYAANFGSAGQALWAETDAANGANNAGPDGVHGVSHSNAGSGVAGVNDAAGGIAVYGRESASGSFAGRFDGDVWVNGNLSKNGGSFKIDHPLDPANKYLYHSFVESPDMKNIYDGVATLDARGEVVVQMPEWFGTLNRDFRYQLTCIGGFAPVYIAEEISHNQFKISGGRAGMKVSWQVTGTRQDVWANAHRIPVEQEKPQDERGTYLHPELYGAPEKTTVGWGRYRFPENSVPHNHMTHRVHGEKALSNPERKPAPETATSY